ncbi:MAG: hypothetical protein AAF705_05175 [Bacteroidota bacterium]
MIQEIALLLSSATLGIFLGAQTVEAFLFVPNWKNLEAEDFYDFYQHYGDKIHHFFAPLTIVTTLTVLFTVGYCLMNSTKDFALFGLLGLSTIAFFSTYFLYFKKANQRFYDRSIAQEELAQELVKWGNWHWVRILFEFIAFGIALYLLMEN